MNATLAGIHRAELKARLRECTPPQRELFVRMYGPHEEMKDKFMYDVTAMAKYHMDIVVDKMATESLSWAVKQVKMSVGKK